MSRADVFAAIRTARNGQGFIASDVAAIDTLLDHLGVARDGGDTDAFERAATAHLRFEEGVKHGAYQDHLGYWTIGVGRLIDPRRGGRITPEEDAILLANDPSRKGKSWREYVLTDAEVNMLLKNDIAHCVAEMADWPSWKCVQGNTARMVAMLSMCFELGAEGLSEFTNSLKMVAANQFSAAADNMLKSKWAGQVPNRAKRVTEMMRTGVLA